MLAATAASRWGGWPRGDPAARRRALDRHRLRRPRAAVLLARAALEQGADSAALATPWPLRPRTWIPWKATASCFLQRPWTASAPGTAPRAATSAPPPGSRPSPAGSASGRRGRPTTAPARARAVRPDRRSACARPDRLDRGRRPPRTGDLHGAAARYAALGARATALRLRLAIEPRQRAPRGRPRRDLTALVAARRSPGRSATPSRCSTARLPRSRRPSSSRSAAPPQRRAATPGPPRRSSAALGTRGARHEPRTASPSPPTLTRLGRHADAAPQFALVLAPRELAASRRLPARPGPGPRRPGGARPAALSPRAPPLPAATPPPRPRRSSCWAISPPMTAPTPRARGYYRQVVTRYPSSRFAPTAAFRAAMIALLAGDAALAAAEFDSLRAALPAERRGGRRDVLGGPRLARRGDTAAARARWELLAAGDPGSYYTGLAAAGWIGSSGRRPPRADSFVPIPAPTARSRAPRCSLASACWRRSAGSTTGWSGRATPRRSACSRWRTRSARTGWPPRPSSSPAARWRWARRPTRAPIACSIPSSSRTRCSPRRANTGSTPASSPP